MKITVKPGFEIGDDCRPFIIAEIGSNWTNLQDCLDSIEKARVFGASAVKFQLFDWDSLYGTHEWTAGPFKNTYSKNGDYRLYLDKEWLPILKDKADLMGIEFMCSAFSPELAEAVNPYVNIHKVASAELTHLRLLQKLNTLGKPVILSTGASTPDDISNALSELRDVPVVLMYCVAAYPAKYIRLEKILNLKAKFPQHLVGFSDHSTDVLVIPKAALITGACVLEKHVTCIDAVTPDSPHSLTVHEFGDMVSHIHNEFVPYDGEEREMWDRHNRRLIATQDIPAGEQLFEGKNFDILRALTDQPGAFTGFMADKVHLQLAKRNIKAGNGIGPGDVE